MRHFISHYIVFSFMWAPSQPEQQMYIIESSIIAL